MMSDVANGAEFRNVGLRSRRTTESRHRFSFPTRGSAKQMDVNRIENLKSTLYPQAPKPECAEILAVRRHCRLPLTETPDLMN